jgi:hypothetical protein
MTIGQGTEKVVSIDAETTVQEMTRGLDWVRWLTQSLRQRGAGIVLPCLPNAATLELSWKHFCTELFLPQLGKNLLAAWEAAHAGDVAALVKQEAAWMSALNAEQSERSAAAGVLLLQCMKGARYTGVLGQLRGALAEGKCIGHIGIVWPAVAVLFQLPPVNMLAEYLRLEWETMTRELPMVSEPEAAQGFAALVQQIMRQPAQPQLAPQRQRVSWA